MNDNIKIEVLEVKVKKHIESIIRQVKSANNSLTREEIISFKGNRSLKQFCFDALFKSKIFCRSGNGKKNSPYLFELAHIFRVNKKKNSKTSEDSLVETEVILDTLEKQNLIELFRILRFVSHQKIKRVGFTNK